MSIPTTVGKGQLRQKCWRVGKRLTFLGVSSTAASKLPPNHEALRCGVMYVCVFNVISLFPVEFVVDCRKFLDSNALGLTIVALSSYDPQMRAAAYSVLAAYYSHLEGARFREQSQVRGSARRQDGIQEPLKASFSGEAERVVLAQAPFL